MLVVHVRFSIVHTLHVHARQSTTKMAESSVALLGVFVCLDDEPVAKRNSEPTDLRNYLRMDKTAVNALLNHVRGTICKKNTKLREAISEEERLIDILRFLATGRSYEDLKFSCAISPQLLGRIIPETCVAIFEALKSEELLTFFCRFDIPDVGSDVDDYPKNCLDSTDGKYIEINKQKDIGAYFYNYKGFFNVVLFAIGNVQYEFIYVNCRTFRMETFYKRQTSMTCLKTIHLRQGVSWLQMSTTPILPSTSLAATSLPVLSADHHPSYITHFCYT
ncbi:hypothetical protein PR048_031896 [Dryococelus australis]|uniref:Uncharacterized protein n=1 Tax=Dryococelus australis TaxID=614101 RepID=A0ABQ9G6L0_9NEOP|nr:hypothetical protein PR048_031896 [Dryococelus australis]